MASRINYSLIKQRYANAGKQGVRLTQSALYLTQAISGTKATYNFDLLDTQNSGLQPNEIRLNLNDEFIVTQMQIGLEADVIVGGASKGKKNFTYVPYELGGSAAVLLPVFDGQLSISVNNIVYLDKFDTRRCEFVQRTQNTIAANTATIDSYDSQKDGVVMVEPMITLSGAKKNQITLQLPSAADAVAALASKDTAGGAITYDINRIFVRFRGLNAQNGASFQN